MSERAQVGSVEELRALKPAVIRFAELAQASVSSSEVSARRTLTWLVHERRPELQREIRVLQEELSRSRSRMVTRADPLARDPSPRVDDRLEFEAVRRRLRRSEETLEEVRRWSRLLERALEEYRGGVSQLGWFVRGELGRAVGALDQMGQALEAYMETGRTPARPDGPGRDGGGQEAGDDA